MRHPILWSLLLIVHTQPARASEPCIAPASECVKQKNSESDTAVRNVNRTPLAMCSQKPLTGWFRDGFCKTDQNDRGRHLVCAQMTDAFLKFTKARGNDLSTPSPRYRFPGLKPGDRWCLCALRWKEAYEAGHAPPVVIRATHEKTLEYVGARPLKALQIPSASPSSPNKKPSTAR